ncbi:MAG: protein kinase [Acidobacteriota bacterium]
MEIGIEEIDRKYEVLGKLGEGGMGAVYKVRHRYLEELRVIKTIRPQLQVDEDLQQRFLREAQVAAKLRHPNIAIIHDFSVGEDGTAYIAMEYIEGLNLRQYQRTRRPLGVAAVLDVGRQTLAALSYLHSKQFVHRDISTDNMMLSQADGRMEVKLIDLGLAKSLQNEHQWKTKTGLVVGKVRYISPEQLNAGMSGVTIDHRSDLYSFGVVLYELLTRKFPITGEDEMSMIAGHLYRPPKSFDETDPEAKVSVPLRQVILKALEKEPDNRFASAAEFSRALAACAVGVAGEPATSIGRTTVLGTDPGQTGATAPTWQSPVASKADPSTVETATWATEIEDPGADRTVAVEGGQAQGEGASKGRRLALAVAATAALALAGVGAWFGFGRDNESVTPSASRAADEPAAATAAASPGAESIDEIFFGSNHALVIGNNNYRWLPPLDTAINDARAVADLLERHYGFEVRLLEDASRHDLISALYDFNEILTARDNLLVYYAGHGQLENKREYWQPIDAQPGRTSNWISTRHEISGTLRDSAARHILVVADSCYSGALAGIEAPAPAPGGHSVEEIRDRVKRSSRLVLTSGGLSPVLDSGEARHSVFARVLLEALRNNRQVVGVSSLFPHIRSQVSKTALDRGGEQVPILAPILDTQDEGGEFFFVPKAATVG